ncbi:YlxR family protein [Micrococcus luteus]
MTSQTPVRTCVGCRERADQTELVRVALDRSTDPPSVQWDSARRRPGRGAWLHRDPECAARALARGGFARSFRTRVDTAAFEEARRLKRHEDEGGSEI